MKKLETIQVEKSDYEVFAYSGGYYGICKIGSSGADPVLGGDSANEDDYNEEYMNEAYNEWDGTLAYCGNDKYGEDGYTING